MMHDDLSPAPKKDLVQSARDFLGSAFGGKHNDLSAAVEDFTAEMTLVAEGLSDDQRRLCEQHDLLSARQTAFEDETLRRFHDQSVDVKELCDKLQKMEQDLAHLRKQVDKQCKKTEGLQGIFRQATWLAAIVCSAWVITALIRFFQ